MVLSGLGRSWSPKVPQQSRLSQRTEDYLDAVRGLAALGVAVGHMRGMFFAFAREVPNPGLTTKAFYLFSGFGNELVMVFFVLSGFLISGNVFRSLQGGWSWRLYLTARLTRLYLVLIPALLLTAAFDEVGSRLLPAGKTYYEHPMPHYVGGRRAPMARHTVGIFFGNVLFLQGIRVPTFSSNGPLWSLSYEFWYYMLFPSVVLVLGVGRASLKQRWLSGIAGVLMLAFLPRDILSNFPIWLMGVCIHYFPPLPDNPRLRTSLRYGAAAMFLAFLIAMRLMSLGIWSGFTIGIACTAFIYTLIGGASGRPRSRYGPVWHLLASFSFTLYVVHFPLLLLVRTWLAETGTWQPEPVRCVWASLVMLGVLLFAWVVSRVTELQTARVRDMIVQATGGMVPRHS